MNKLKIGSPEWLEARNKYVTATDLPVIMGIQKWGKTPLQLYEEKISGIAPKQNYAMKRGLELEEEARQAYEKEKGIWVFPKFIVKDGWMAASVDGINEDGKLMEIKCPGAQDHFTALKGEIPTHYYPQLQWQMEVCGIECMDYFSYRPSELEKYVTISVQKNEEYIQSMKNQAAIFYQCLINKIPPQKIDLDPIYLEDEEFLKKEIELENDMKMLKYYTEKVAINKKELLKNCKGPTQGNRLKIIPLMLHGSVDYAAIPELKNVNLEKYRKPPRISWRIDRINKE